VPLFLGFLLAPFIARALPFGLDGRVAALIMHGDRWHVPKADRLLARFGLLRETRSPFQAWMAAAGI
jgi:hypothetical protein